MTKQEIGKITHYFDKISVAVIELTQDLKLGDKISIEGHDNITEIKVSSMEIDRTPIEHAKSGQAVGIKTSKSVKAGDKVHIIIE